MESEIGFSSNLVEFIRFQKMESKIPAIAKSIINYVQLFKKKLRGGQSISQVLVEFYKNADNSMQRTNQQAPPVSCKKGCAFCCNINVDICSAEAKSLVKYAKKKGIPIDREYLRKQSQIPKKELVLHPAVSKCVFLSKQNTCMVYPVRPLICRGYAVISPAEMCNSQKHPSGKILNLVDINVMIMESALLSLYPDLDRMPLQIIKILDKNEDSKYLENCL